MSRLAFTGCTVFGAIDVVVCSTGLIGLTNDRSQVLAGARAEEGGGQVGAAGARRDRLGEPGAEVDRP